jgi:hypothetical protein
MAFTPSVSGWRQAQMPAVKTWCRRTIALDVGVLEIRPALRKRRARFEKSPYKTEAYAHQ